MSQAKFVAFQRRRSAKEVLARMPSKWGWRLVHANGNVLATDGSQGYWKRSEAVEIGMRVCRGEYWIESVE